MTPLATKRKSPEDDAFRTDEAKTPTGSPPKKKMKITRSQKQALMDNLQLEITERARKLRAQYALQANDLRARIERRVNRIPVALRKANMGELLEKHSNASRAQLENVSPKKHVHPTKGTRNITTISVDQDSSAAGTNARRTKKQSHEYFDKENAPAAGEQIDALKNPKRRGKPGAASGTSRVVSQEVRGPDYRILSPKSLNSRTYPQSPFRASPGKPQPSYLSRPMSPLKPTSPLKATSASLSVDNARARSKAAAENRPASQQSKRPVSRAATGVKGIRSPLSRPATRQADRKNSTGTVSSTASSGTTVVKPTRTGTGARKATNASTTSSTVTKKTAASRAQAPTAAAKRNTASQTKKTTAPSGGEAPTTGRRVLRKRV
ncbi:hypothetical protein ASPWEDRAFT_44599 [Aspergillus wentii DTO 134E9]|uniref:Borealin N-terminal domain-containing protein n=1 Tax=Aspergillus wentii DTO 134E9 TaxID=1073089 RepID=A0A1L9RC69_ASPWE|nr:uncharacterized protein ASPWEDRAFT_44599 [Aspergillus wentii DTO 134E9]KAI9935026.1 hypothetical protein MW887_000647 [Aspergillus wentii]OJJ32467.1 hypothetical protein ASPWEDRAFT_44599 [Aspergillus wentii DTO 134E9]